MSEYAEQGSVVGSGDFELLWHWGTVNSTSSLVDEKTAKIHK